MTVLSRSITELRGRPPLGEPAPETIPKPLRSLLIRFGITRPLPVRTGDPTLDAIHIYRTPGDREFYTGNDDYAVRIAFTRSNLRSGLELIIALAKQLP